MVIERSCSDAERYTEAKAYHYRWAEIYDSTSLNGYIDFCYYYGYDYFSVASSSDNGPFYLTLDLYPTSVNLTYTDSYIDDKADEGYNSALDMYGYWPN